MEIQQESTMQTVKSPITCPKCGSKNLEFVAEYHKLIGLRIAILFVFILAAILVYIAIYNFQNKIEMSILYLMLTSFAVCALLAFVIIIIIFESRTHIKSVCRDCGHIWNID